MSATVLILHSSSSTASSFAATIDGIGFRSVLPVDVDAACQSIRISRPDLVLVDGDLQLKDPSLCRKLRLCSPEKHLPIILLIPQSIDNISSYLVSSDVDDYISQPYSINELEARLMLRLSVSEKNAIRSLPEIDFSFLNSLSGLATSELSHSEIFQRVVASVSAVIDVNRCSILLLNEKSENAQVMAASDDPGINGLQVALEKYPEIQETIQSGRPLLIDNVFEHPLMKNVCKYLQKGVVNSILVLPMIDRKKIVGVMLLRSARPISGFSEDEVYFCQLVTNVATSALRMADASALDGKIQNRKSLSKETVSGTKGEAHSSLLDVAAHDLRVLVSVIDGYCMLFSETSGEQLLPEQSEIVSGLMAGNRRLVDMANDLLDFSQLNSGSFNLNLAEHDICQAFGSVCSELAPLLNRRNINFRCECLNRQLMIICDQNAIQRVFYNILNNAIKFTPEGGEIRLYLKDDATEVRVTIEDTGPGIEPSHIATLFDEYTTVSMSDSRAGNGLGLSICKKIIEAHHGRIWAESFIGQGSRFIFCLPL